LRRPEQSNVLRRGCCGAVIAKAFELARDQVDLADNAPARLRQCIHATILMPARNRQYPEMSECKGSMIQRRSRTIVGYPAGRPAIASL
jgi:hypothetical protein